MKLLMQKNNQFSQRLVSDWWESLFSCKLRYIVGFRLVEMAISTNPKPTIYRNLYENKDTGHAFYIEYT